MTAEELQVEVLAVHALGRELAARANVSPVERRRYEEWRAEVLERAGALECACC